MTLPAHCCVLSRIRAIPITAQKAVRYARSYSDVMSHIRTFHADYFAPPSSFAAFAAAEVCKLASPCRNMASALAFPKTTSGWGGAIAIDQIIDGLSVLTAIPHARRFHQKRTDLEIVRVL